MVVVTAVEVSFLIPYERTVRPRLEAAEDADVLVRDDDARARGVLDRELGLAALTRQAPGTDA
jgi:hypothetical protein